MTEPVNEHNHPLESEAIQEQAAGYVLGDLTSEEAEQFQQLLKQQPALGEEVAALQEALAMMPYALPETKPTPELRSRILQATQADFEQDFSPSAPFTQQPAQPRPRPPKLAHKKRRQRTWMLGSVAASLAVIALSVNYWQPAGDFLSQTTPTNPPPLENTQIDQVWSGFGQLVKDHHDSVNNPNGPADFAVQQADDVIEQLKGFQTNAAALPTLPEYEGKLLGGSDCQFDETRGLRLSYQVDGTPDTAYSDTSQVVSIYQLDLNGDQFPQFRSSYMTLREPDGTGVVLWREENYLYALVAELPVSDLNSLAHKINRI
ncbi:MAG: hypothetical protein AAFO06_22665 [Cyanobacteria bacterium J06597_16]